LYNCSAFIENGREIKGNVTEIGLIKYLIDSQIDADKILQ